MGILKPHKVDGLTGYRYYAADQVKQLDALLELRHLGFSLAEVRELLKSGMASENYIEALHQKKMMWRERIAVAEGKIDMIDEITAKLRIAKPATRMHELTEAERARLLSRMAYLEDFSIVPDTLSEALWL